MTPKQDQQQSSGFTTRAQTEFRRRNGRRFAGAALVAFVMLLVLVWLGPDKMTVKRKFEMYGAPGELKIMPEISIENGTDKVHQLPKSLQQAPPPSYVVPDEADLSPKATEEIPVPRPLQPLSVLNPAETLDPDAEIASKSRVELKLPSQSNPDWYILKEVRPEYPISAQESERKTPIIFVRAAIFVGPEGTVREKMILATNGSRAFTEAVLNALGQWRFGWRVAPGEGRWIEMTWNFKSPYFIGGSSQVPPQQSHGPQGP